VRSALRPAGERQITRRDLGQVALGAWLTGATLHTLARRAYEHYESARRTLADFIHAPDP
jgi:hypothetical protein